jgi:hypothetical protein
VLSTSHCLVALCCRWLVALWCRCLVALWCRCLVALWCRCLVALWCDMSSQTYFTCVVTETLHMPKCVWLWLCMRRPLHNNQIITLPSGVFQGLNALPELWVVAFWCTCVAYLILLCSMWDKPHTYQGYANTHKHVDTCVALDPCWVQISNYNTFLIEPVRV